MNPVIIRRDCVRRSLFGPVDHETLRRDLTLKLKQISEEENTRWNFNFQTNTPLRGRFQWEEIPATRAASLYQERDNVCSTHTGDNVCSTISAVHFDDEERRETDQENCSNISNTPIKNKLPAEVTPTRRRKRTLSKMTKSGNNARITDFFTKRRKSTETKSLHTTSSEAALCKTIR